MAKVTISYTPEEANEGEFGHTAIYEKKDVVLLADLLLFLLNSVQGAGWYIYSLEANTGAGKVKVE